MSLVCLQARSAELENQLSQIEPLRAELEEAKAELTSSHFGRQELAQDSIGD